MQASTIMIRRPIAKMVVSVKSKLHNLHPGEILLQEILKPLGISAYRLSQATGKAE
jgi:hypothetical protein